jgi:O-methyltransferase domain
VLEDRGTLSRPPVTRPSSRKSVLMDCADDQARVILRHVRQAMDGNGAVLIIETVIGAPNQGEPAAFSDPNLLVATGGRVRGPDDWRVLLTDTGFDLVDVNLPPVPNRITAAPDRRQEGCCTCGPTIIHGVPNRSMHMPNAWEKNVGSRAWVTFPPSARASKTRLAPATSAAS